MQEQHLKANAERVIQELRPVSGMDFGYNKESVKWLEGHLEQLRLSGAFQVEETKNQLADLYGSFLGECIIQCYGGSWAEHDGMWGVAFDQNNIVFPFAKVAKQMDNGLEDGIGTMFRCIPVLYGKPFIPGAEDDSVPRKTKSPFEGIDSDDDLLNILDEKVRNHHYGFAHRELPRLIWKDPELYVSTLFNFNPDANRTLPALRHFLYETWETLGNELPPEEKLPPDGLDIVRRNLANGYQIVVITMPPAVQMAEAQMIAVAYRPERLRRFFNKEKSVLRYFTLELGITRERTACTRLCEWTRDGAHVNYDEGPPVEIDAFCKALEPLLDQ